MKVWLNKFVLVSIVFLLLASCVPEPTAPPPTPIPTSSPIPSSTPVPAPLPTNTPTLAPTSTPVLPEIKITSPIDGGEVDLKLTIEGTSKNIPEGSVVWIVVFLPVTNRYYPTNEPAVVAVGGNWSALAQIGREDEKGLEAHIIAILADGAVQDAFKAYLTKAIRENNYPGMDLPPGTLVYDRVAVTRR